MRFRPDEILLTERLRLRPPAVSDAAPIFDAYAQDPEVSRYTVWTPHLSVAVTEQFLHEAIAAWRGDARFVWVIEERDPSALAVAVEGSASSALVGGSEGNASGALVGGIEARVDGHKVELGYVLARPAWGKGYASEAVGRLIEHAFASPAVWRVFAYCSVDNAGSVGVLERCGMEREGRVRRGFVFPNVSPEPADVYLYAITRDAMTRDATAHS